MFTSWQQHPALSVCSSKHFYLAHFWSSCLISLWRQKSFKPHCILGQHIYWGLAFQYLREINTAPWFMNPCHPPTGLVRGPTSSTLILPLHTIGFRYQREHTHTCTFFHTSHSVWRQFKQWMCINHPFEFFERCKPQQARMKLKISQHFYIYIYREREK